MKETVRILFVDDEVNILRSLERVFLEDDYEILTATCGAEALDILDQVSPVQVVVSDYRMPGMDGVEFLRRVKGMWPESVRAVLSGYADTAAIVSAINEGQIYRFIPKPWNDTDLRMTIAAAVEQHKRQAKEIMYANTLQHRIEELERENSFLVRRVAEVERATSAEAILEALPVGVMALDVNGDVIRCNPEALRLFAGGEHAPIVHLTDPRLPGGFRDLLERSSSGGKCYAELPAGNGKTVFAVCRVEPAGGSTLAMVAFYGENSNG